MLQVLCLGLIMLRVYVFDKANVSCIKILSSKLKMLKGWHWQAKVGQRTIELFVSRSGMKMAWVWGGGGAEVIDKLVRVVLRIIMTCVYNSRYECLQTLNINTESPALKALMCYNFPSPTWNCEKTYKFWKSVGFFWPQNDSKRSGWERESRGGRSALRLVPMPWSAAAPQDLRFSTSLQIVSREKVELSSQCRRE